MKKETLNTETKKALRQDIRLANKIIDALGGEISVDSYLGYINRNSPKLTKEKILKIISQHLSVDTQTLFTNLETVFE